MSEKDKIVVSKWVPADSQFRMLSLDGTYRNIEGPGVMTFTIGDRRTAGMYRRKRGHGVPEFFRRKMDYGRRVGDREYHEIKERRQSPVKKYETSADFRIKALERRKS